MNEAATVDRGDLLARALGFLERRIGTELDEGGIGNAARAELRHLDVERTLPPAFWKLVVAPQVTAVIAAFAPAAAQRLAAERAFAAIMQAMAQMAGPGGPRLELGEALADTGYS